MKNRLISHGFSFLPAASRPSPSARLGLLLCGLLLSGMLARPLSGAEPLPRVHVVKAGQSCLSIVNGVYGGRLSLETLHRLNPELGAPPHHLKTGQTLYLQPRGLKPDAHLTWVVRKVETRKPEEVAWSPGSVGKELFRLYRVATRDSALAEVTFQDEAQLQLTERSLLVIYGDLFSTARTREKTGVELVEGSLRGGLASLRGEKAPARPLQVATPGAQVKARSKELNLEVDERKTTRLSVYHGQASIASAGVEVKVPAGKGTLAALGKAPEPPRPLPPPPTLPGGLARTAGRASGDRTLSLSWDPVKDASTYLVDVASDAAFRQLVVQQRVSEPRITLPDLPAGRLYWRVSSRSADGLQGQASVRQELALVELGAPGLQARPDGSFAASRFSTLKVPKVAGLPPVELLLDGAVVPGGEVMLEQPGWHTVSARVASGGMQSWQVRLEVADLTVDSQLPPLEVPAAGGAAEIRLKLKDIQGQGVAVSGARLTVEELGNVPLREGAPGELLATVVLEPTLAPRALGLSLSLPGDTAPRAVGSLRQAGPPPLEPKVGGSYGMALLGVEMPSSELGAAFGLDLEVGRQGRLAGQRVSLGGALSLARVAGQTATGDAQGELGGLGAGLRVNLTWRRAWADLPAVGYLGLGAGGRLFVPAADSGLDRVVAPLLMARGGLEAQLGPGSVCWQLGYGWSPGQLGETKVNLAGPSIQVGYRLGAF